MNQQQNNISFNNIFISLRFIRESTLISFIFFGKISIQQLSAFIQHSKVLYLYPFEEERAPPYVLNILIYSIYVYIPQANESINKAHVFWSSQINFLHLKSFLFFLYFPKEEYKKIACIKQQRMSLCMKRRKVKKRRKIF